MKRLLLILSVLAGPALAQTCPPAPDHAARQDELLAELKLSRGAVEANAISDQLWRIWTDAPDLRAQDLLDRGMGQRESADFLGARQTLDELVAYCPDYAEGYNQRAFASFLVRDFPAALADLDAALAINPQHVGALSGKGLTLLGLGRRDEAQEALKAAVALNPWLRERDLIEEPEGTDI